MRVEFRLVYDGVKLVVKGGGMVGEVGRDYLPTEKKMAKTQKTLGRRAAIGELLAILGLTAVAGWLGWDKLIKPSLEEREEYGERVEYEKVEPGDRLMIELGEDNWQIKPIKYRDYHNKWVDIKVERLHLRDEPSRIRRRENGIVMYVPEEFKPGTRTVRHTAEVLSLRAEKLSLKEGVSSVGVYPHAGERLQMETGSDRVYAGESFWGLPVIVTFFREGQPYEENRHYIPSDAGPRIERFTRGFAVLKEFGDEIRVMGYCADEGALKPVE